MIKDVDVLAYIGDAVYEVYIREYLTRKNETNVNKLHKKATLFVRAESQAKVIKGLVKKYEKNVSGKVIIDGETNFLLTEEEYFLVKRGRNHKFKTKAKNADPVTYKWSTAFEALMGYLHENEKYEREKLLVEYSIKVIEEVGEKNESSR